MDSQESKPSRRKRYALWGAIQIPAVMAVFTASYKSRGGSGEAPSLHDLATLPPELFVGVVAWGLVTSFLVRVWKEIEDDAVKTTAAKLRAIPSYAASLLGRLWDACQGWLVAWSPGFERIYRKRVHEKYGIFNDRGLGLINANRLDLEKVYVELSIHSDVTFKTPPVDPLRRPVEGREPVWRFLRELRTGYALVLLGAPGSGKTTLLHHLLLTYARGRQWRFRARRRVPAFLEFRSLASLITANLSVSLSDAFRHQIKAHLADLEKDLPAGWVERCLRHGRMILLFDGLDEVASPEARRAVSAWLEDHLTAQASRGNLFLATSRPGGYQDAPLERARVLQVEPFSPAQSRRFMQCWYLQNEIISSGLKETDPVRRRAQEDTEDLLRRLSENPDLYDLSVNPLLLTMLCMVHRYHGALPGSRSQLYAEICQVLLERWRQARGVTDADGLRGEQKLSVLRPLAEAYMLAGRRELQDKEILPHIESHLQAVGYTKAPLEFLRTIQAGSGLLVEKEAGSWAWSHKTFQEYLTAEYWLERLDKPRNWPKFVADEWWRETVLLYAAKADSSAPLAAALAKKSPVAWSLAWRLLAEASRLKPDIRARAEAELYEALRSRDPIRFLPAAHAHHDLRMREWIPTANGVRCRKAPVSNAEYQLFLLQVNPSKRWALVPPHWREDWFRGEPEESVLGVLPWQVERLVASLQGSDDRVVTTLPRGTNELSPNLADSTIWSQKWDLLFPTESPPPASVLVMPRQSVLWFIIILASDLLRARTIDRALARTIDLTRGLERALDRDLAGARTRELVRNLTLARNFSRARAQDLDLDIARDRDLDLDLTPDLTRGLDLNVARDLNLARGYAIARALAFDRTLGHTFARAREFARALQRAIASHRAFDLDTQASTSARARALERDLARNLDSARALEHALNELRRTQFDFGAVLTDYCKQMPPASLFDLEFLINDLQLLNDRLEGKAEPVEVIALVRRERP